MTETDSKIVKDHIAIDEKNSPQLLEKLTDLITKEWDKIKFFFSREIKPVVSFGTYNHYTKKIEFGTGYLKGSYDTTAAATTVLTVTAGQTWRIIYAAMTNGTRNFGVQLSGVIGGVTMTLISDTGAAAVTSTKVIPIIGGNGPCFATTIPCLAGPLILRGGDSLTMTDTAYVALDTTKHIWLYEVINS